MSFSSAFMNTFQETLQHAEEWFKPIAIKMGWDEGQAYHGFRAVIHALRDRLTVDEAAHLASHMPMLIRGIFYDGWKPSKLPIKMKTREEFYDYVLQCFNINTDLDVERLTNAVLGVVTTKVTSGDIQKIVRMLPEDLQRLWP